MFNWFSDNDNNEWRYDNLPTPESDDDYIRLAKKVIDNRMKWIKDKDNWELLINEDGITVHQRQVNGSPIHMIKATTILHNVDINNILNWLYKATLDEKRLIIDDVIDHEIVQNINNNIHVSRSRYSTPVGISNREFLALRVSHMRSDTTYLVGIQSINKKDIPFDNDYVRGISNCATLLEDLGDNTVKITSIDHIDPKGWIPAFVINAYKRKAKERLEKIQKVFTKN